MIAKTSQILDYFSGGNYHRCCGADNLEGLRLYHTLPGIQEGVCSFNGDSHSYDYDDYVMPMTLLWCFHQVTSTDTLLPAFTICPHFIAAYNQVIVIIDLLVIITSTHCSYLSPMHCNILADFFQLTTNMKYNDHHHCPLIYNHHQPHIHLCDPLIFGSQSLWVED